MKTKRFFLVLIPLLAFMLVACGDFFDGDIIEEELDQGGIDDEFRIEPDEVPEPIYEDETWDDEGMWETEDDFVEEEQPVDPRLME